MKRNRLSFKYLVEIVDDINKANGKVYDDKGYLHMGGDSGYYELDVHHILGSTSIKQLVRGTLREVLNYLQSHNLYV